MKIRILLGCVFFVFVACQTPTKQKSETLTPHQKEIIKRYKKVA